MDVNEINKEIKRLELADTDYVNCQRLAILYVVKDHLTAGPPAVEYSLAAEPTSEFLSVSLKKDLYKVMDILDEHIECIKALYPAEYRALIKKITDL